jgi:putative transposase
MRRPSKIELTDEQRTTLTIWLSAGKTEQRLAKRAQVIIYATDGISLKDIAVKVGLGFQSCLKWRKRFVEHGLKGLRDIPRKGRPAVITPQERVHVMALACTKPDDASNQWTTTKLADATGFSRTTVHRILNEASLKPHKIDQWCGNVTYDLKVH